MDQNCSSRDPWEHKQVIDELIQGKELAKQLQIHLNTPNSSHEIREILVNKILSSYDKSLSLLYGTWIGNENENVNESNWEVQASVGTATMGIWSSFSGSPHSEDSDREFKDSDKKDFPKKRKSNFMEKWKQVKVRPEIGVEGPLDDGYSWRKYGQKDILGAKHPRGYYRCTYRQVQGCFATKQIQRSDEDPNTFDIMYRGRHTCNPNLPIASPLIPPSPPPLPPSLAETHQPPQQNQILQSSEILLNFQTDLKVITENLDTPPFHFPSTSNNNFIFPTLENNFQGSISPSFISPTTSGSPYFSMSSPRMGGFEGNTSVVAESELNELVSAATSSTSSPTFGMGFPFDEIEFNNNFSFDNSRFLE